MNRHGGRIILFCAVFGLKYILISLPLVQKDGTDVRRGFQTLCLNDGDAIADLQTVQEFSERVPVETGGVQPVYDPFNNVQRPCTGLLTVCEETEALLSVPPVLNGRLQVRHGLSLYDETPWKNILTGQTYPNIPNRKIPCRDI